MPTPRRVADHSAQPRTSSSDAESQLTLELTKMILASNLEYARATIQTLQALSAALLTASVAAAVALRAVSRFQDVPVTLAGLPSVCFASALLSLVVTGLARRRQLFDFNALDATLTAYEDLLSRRRRDAFLPAALLGAGLIAAFAVLLSAG